MKKFLFLLGIGFLCILWIQPAQAEEFCVQIGSGVDEWSSWEFKEDYCPNGSGKKAPLRNRYGRANVQCNQGMVQWNVYHCRPGNSWEYVVIRTRTCDEGDYVTTRWREYEMGPETPWYPWECFADECRVYSAWGELAEEDCYEE